MSTREPAPSNEAPAPSESEEKESSFVKQPFDTAVMGGNHEMIQDGEEGRVDIKGDDGNAAEDTENGQNNIDYSNGSMNGDAGEDRTSESSTTSSELSTSDEIQEDMSTPSDKGCVGADEDKELSSSKEEAKSTETQDHPLASTAPTSSDDADGDQICSACSVPLPKRRFTRSQLKKARARCEECVRVGREVGGSSTADGVSMDLQDSLSEQLSSPAPPVRDYCLTSDAALTIGDEIEIWLPKGTPLLSQGAWVARIVNSDTLLSYRVPFRTPYNAIELCRYQGGWLRVRMTQRGTLEQIANKLKRKPQLDADTLPEPLRNPRSPSGSSPSYGCNATFTIYAPNDTKSVRLEWVGGKGSTNLVQMGKTNCWRTPTPLSCGHGWMYVSVIETPGILRGILGTKKTRSEKRRVHGSDIIDFGEGDEPRCVRAGRMAKSIISEAAASLSEPTLQLYAKTLSHIAQLSPGDLSDVVNFFLENSPNALQVQLILTILGKLIRHRVSGRRLLAVLNKIEPPSNIISATVAAMPKIHQLFQKQPVWLSLVRWQLSPRQLAAVDARPFGGDELIAFNHSLHLLASWHATDERARQTWRGEHLAKLLTKLLKATPGFESLQLLLETCWTITVSAATDEVNAAVVHAADSGEATDSSDHLEVSGVCTGARQATIEQIIKAPEVLSSHWSPRILKTTLNQTLRRCLRPFMLTELLQFHSESPEYKNIIRVLATDLSRWDGTPELQLSAVKTLDFDRDKEQSKILLRNLTHATSVAKIRLFPHLLKILLGVEKIFVECMTRDWVNQIIEVISTEGPSQSNTKVVGVSGMLKAISDDWETWSYTGLVDAKEQLKLEVLKLHKKTGYGGGMMMLAVAKQLGLESFERTPVFKQWMLPAVKAYMEERCLGSLQSKSAALQQGRYAREMLMSLTIEVASGDLRQRIVVNKLCEQLLLTLLGILQPSVPIIEEMKLLSHLLTRDQALFWPPLLRMIKAGLPSSPATGYAEMGAHKLFKRICDVIVDLGDQLKTRSIPFDRADKLLSESHKDGHAILMDYLASAGDGMSMRGLDAILHLVDKQKKAHEALQYFGETFCSTATDFETMKCEIQRVNMAFKSGVPLNEASDEEHWGDELTPRMRQVAAATYRLKESKLFKQEWENALKAISGEEESLEVTTLVTVVYQAAITAFQANCRRMLDADNPITVGEVAHIFGTPRNEEQAHMLEGSLQIELDLMFQREKTPHEVQAVQVLHDHLICFARLRKTLGEASAIRGFMCNILATDQPPATAQAPSEQVELQELALELIKLGSETKDGELCSTCSLCDFAATSHRFHQMLLPTYKQALDAAEQLGLPAARELLNFVRDLEDDALHDIVDSGNDDKADVTDAITSLLRVDAVIRAMLRAPPANLIGSAEGALELLGARLQENRMTGIELAGHIESCMANLYALTHRNKNMGEQAMDSIRAIVEKGTFIFQGGLEVRCADIPTPFTSSRLDDFRSHALLGVHAHRRDVATNTLAIANSEADGEIQVNEVYLGLIAASESICASIAELRMLGHFDVYTLSLHVKSDLGQLQKLQQYMAQECHNWRQAVREARERNFMLSFFASRQLWELYTSLCCAGGSPSHLLCYVPSADTSCGFSSRSSVGGSSISGDGTIDLTKDDDPDSISILDEQDGTPMSGAYGTKLNTAKAIEQLNILGSALSKRFEDARPQGRLVNGWRKRHLVSTGTVCFVRRSDVLETCLALYAADGVLPAHCQLLFCSAETMHEEIEAFLHRAFYSYNCTLTEKQLFCILRIDQLTESLYLYLKIRLEKLYDTVRPRLVRLALICDERAHQHRISSDLMSLVKEVEPASLDHRDVRKALLGQRHDVVVVSSSRAGLGKTQWIKAQAHGKTLRTVVIAGLTTRTELVSNLLSVIDSSRVDVLHLNILDIPTSCAEAVNDMLFELLCLNMICSSADTSTSLVFVPCKTIYIELANSVGGQNEILQRAPILNYFGCADEVTPNRIHLQWDLVNNGYQLLQPLDDAQVTCRYLQALDNGTITADVPHTQLDAGQCWVLLDDYFISGHTQQPSFAQLRVFTSVLANQFRRFEESAAFFPWVVQEIGHPNVRAVVVRCLVDAAARFATRCVPDSSDTRSTLRSAHDTQISRELQVQSFDSVNYMLLLMQKEMAITIFPGPTLFGRAASELKRYYDSQRQMTGADLALPEWRDIPQKLPNLNRGATDLLDELINFTGADVRREHLRANFERCRYTLTADNALKMMLVHVRVSAGEPVIISGETGCGKTSLIKFLLFLLGKESDFLVLNVHAGIGKERITAFVRMCEDAAKRTDNDVWVFFDEVNTSPYVSVVSELMCRRTLNGRPVNPRLRFLACVNPHRLRTREVESVGLQSKLNTEDPMRRLVYRVHKLPQAMLDYVWDYGRLAERDEASYIANMLSDSLLPSLEANLVFQSQCFVRKVEEDCSVSLRDVRRFKKLVSWFYATRIERALMEKAAQDADESEQPWWERSRCTVNDFFSRTIVNQLDESEVAVVLALAHCYYCRLPTPRKRQAYLEMIEKHWQHNLSQSKSHILVDRKCFLEIVHGEQHEYVSRMEVPEHLGVVAINTALLENIFVLLVCIVNRIPVFLVGKPGCSKTLSMQLILENLRGKGSNFPYLPCVYGLRYQCSEDSTSDGIEAIFESAKRKAAKDEPSEVTYVVVLDEIGLAEVSRHNPLKVLHDRLEPDARQEYTNVDAKNGHDLPYAVVGISNWALDSSKMNRAIVLSRPDPSEKDLEETAVAMVERMSCIVGRVSNNHLRLLKAVSKAYHAFKQPSCEYVYEVIKAMLNRGVVDKSTKFSEAKQRLSKVIANFHGLRDFYALNRTIGSMADPDPVRVAIAIARNFNGLPGSAERFQRLLLKEIIYMQEQSLNISSLSLIGDNLRDPRARHLMLISRGDAAMCLLRLPQIKQALHNPHMMLASSFKEDNGAMYDYQQLSRISQHMIAGRQLIIKDFDSIYGALYDMLNQTYLVHKKRKCRVALENASKQVEVHDNFRCIMIEEERDLQHSDPPRLNRCEKQCLAYLDVLQDLDSRLCINSGQLLSELQSYCHNLSSITHMPNVMAPSNQMEVDGDDMQRECLKTRDTFLGFTEDTLPSLLVREMQAAQAHPLSSSEDIVATILSRCKATLHDLMPADAVMRSELSVFGTNPENREKLQALADSYLNTSYHAGLKECLQHVWPSLLKDQNLLEGAEAGIDDEVDAMEVDLEGIGDVKQDCLLVLTFTNYSCNLRNILTMRMVDASSIKILRIGAFESEKTLRAEVDTFWSESSPCDLLLMQADVELHSQHLLLMREIMREAEETYRDATVATRRPKAQAIILHLHRFQSGTAYGQWEFSHLSEWKQITVDRLEGEARDVELLKAARSMRDATELMTNRFDNPMPLASLLDLIKSQLPWAVRRLGYPHSNTSATLNYVDTICKMMLGNGAFLERLEQRLSSVLTARSASKMIGKWLPELSNDLGGLIKASSLTMLIRKMILSSVRELLALVMHQLDGRSALAGLRSCRSNSEKALWLELYLPNDEAQSVLGPLVQPSQTDWVPECLQIVSHSRKLHWAFSVEFEKQMRLRKTQIVKLCESEWSQESTRSIIRGLCSQFLKDPLLRRLAIICTEKFGGDHAETAKSDSGGVDPDKLSQQLETFWMDNRLQFKDDMQIIIAAELATGNQGITADRILTLIDAALLPAHALHDEWHPADICIQHWRVEPTLRHALQLFLLIDDRFEFSGKEDFAVELVDRAAQSCLTKSKDDASAWLATALRCLNYTHMINESCETYENAEAQLVNRPSVWQLQLCSDFCQRVVLKLKERLRGKMALTKLTQSELARDEVVCILNEFRDELSSTDSDEAGVDMIDLDGIQSIDEFKFIWIVRQLKIATAGEKLAAVGQLGSLLQTGTWVAGEIPPSVGCAIHSALDALGLFESYDTHRGNSHCFDGLTAAIESSMRTDAALAGAICSKLQQYFAQELQQSFNGVSPRSGTTRDDSLDKTGSKRQCLPHESCADLPKAFNILQTRLNGRQAQAFALYHLAFVKAFVQVVCTILQPNCNLVHRIELAAALNDVLAEQSTDSEQPVASLQEYVLKELRRWMSMDELMQSFRSGALSALLPNLKARCDLAIALPTASKLGFDPFATYGNPYRAARKALQTSCDGKAPDEACDLHPTLYAVTTALYLPRSLREATKTEMANALRGVLQLVRGSDRQTSLGKLIRALAEDANHAPLTQAMALSPQTPRLDVCLSSLAVHLSVVLDAANPVVNPFALYAKQPANARNLFVVCAPCNEMAIAMRAAAVRGRGHANTPYRCQCGFMYVVGNCGMGNESRACPQCGQTIGRRGHMHTVGRVLSNGQREFALDKPGYIIGDETAYGEFSTLREMNAISFRTLHLLTHLSLFCGRLLGTNGLGMLVANQADPVGFCWGVALRDFQMIPALLGPSTEIEACAWLHDVIKRMPSWCEALGTGRGVDNRFTTAQQRQAWEAAFGRDLIQGQPGFARACVVARPLTEGPRPMLHRLVDEEDGLVIEQKGLWSIINTPTVHVLQATFLAANGRDKHPFLDLCLKQLELLDLTQHLTPFLQWEQLLREHWSSHLDRGDAREMSVDQLLTQTTDGALRSRATAAFEDFSAAWNVVVSLLREGHDEASHRYAELCDCHPVAPVDMPLDLSIDDHVTRGCIDPEICADPAGNLFRIFLYMLAKAQNDFLGMVIDMVPRCEALTALSLGGNAVWLDSSPQTKLLQMQSQHALLNDTSSLRSCLLGSCVSQTGHGVNGRVTFDFAAIEMNLAALLLTGSRHIDINADDMGNNGMMAKQAPPIFLFKGELFLHFKDLNHRVSEQMQQEPVTNARALRQDPFLQEPRNCLETLALLETVLYTATKSMPAPDERLANFCDDFKRMVIGSEGRGRSRVVEECKAIGEVPLKQLRSLYELVEDLVADAVLPTLPGRFCVPLPSVEIADKACLELGRHAISVGASDAVGQAAAMRAGRLRLEPALKRFIYRELKPSKILSDANLNTPLYHSIRWSTDFPWTMGDQVSDNEIDAAFDEAGDPALKHTYALWCELQRRGGSTAHSGSSSL